MDRGHLEVESPDPRLQAKYGILLPGHGATVAMEACLDLLRNVQMTSTKAGLTPEEVSSESCMTPSGASPREIRQLTSLVAMKGTTRIGTWNIRTLQERPPKWQARCGNTTSELAEWSRTGYTCNWRADTRRNNSMHI